MRARCYSRCSTYCDDETTEESNGIQPVQRARDEVVVIPGVDSYIGPQVETMVILLGTLFVVIIWGFFQHHSE